MTRILLIDDDPLLRVTLAAALSAAGHVVVEADNGIEGVAEARRHRPDLVVVDIIMPEQDGIETLIRLRASDPDLPVLAIGGGRARAADFLSLATGFGATATLAKPCAPEVLVEAVRRCLAAAQPAGPVQAETV
ncbi:MAG: response regulator transcription factor [Ferrovibrionaceae bacterium]